MANRARPGDRVVGTAILIAGLLLALSLAWRAATTPAPDSVAWATSTALDIGVGLVFVVVGAIAPGTAWERAWIGATGIAWMAATWLPSLSGVHQGLLLAAVVLFASGVPRSTALWIAAVISAFFVLGVWPQPVVAVGFIAAALFAVRDRARRRLNALPALGAAVVGIVLAASWIASRLDPATFRPVVGLRVYEGALIAAAGLLAAAMWRLNRPGALIDSLLRQDTATGIAGMERLLRNVFADPELAIVSDGERAVVMSTSSLLRDRDTLRDVDEAVNLAARHATLTASLERQREDLEAARRRLVTSVDHRRAIVARRLRREILVPLTGAEGRLRAVRDRADSPERRAAIETALHEVETARRDVVGMVRGIPPVALGDGRIVTALKELVLSAGPTASLSVAPGARGDEATELSLFYACSEALANALRHADASCIEVTLAGGAAELRLSVRDNGRGGAEPSPGSGLEGLEDRVSAAGGSLRVDTGAEGTTITVRVPVTAASATVRG